MFVMQSIFQIQPKLGRFITYLYPFYLYMVELEILNDFRDYKLVLKYNNKCKCGGALNLHMINNSVNQICNDNWCRKQYKIKRQCTKCKSDYLFEDITCDRCEPEVIRQAELHMEIMNSEKALKKLNRAYKAGKINEADWKSGIKLYKETKEKCEEQL